MTDHENEIDLERLQKEVKTLVESEQFKQTVKDVEAYMTEEFKQLIKDLEKFVESEQYEQLKKDVEAFAGSEYKQLFKNLEKVKKEVTNRE